MPHSSSARRRLTLSAIGLAFALGACASTDMSHTRPKPVDPTHPAGAAPTALDQFKAATRPSENRIALAPHAHGVLSDAQRSALMLLAHQLDENDSQIVEIKISSKEPETGDAAHTARSALDYLQSIGLATERLKLGRFESDVASAPVVVSYHGVEAYGPDCNKNWDNLSATGANSVSKHFGCAQAANLAAMVADPRDLIRPAPEGPSDATRRGVVLGKYRKGESSSTVKDEQASGAVSQTVK